MGSGIVTRKLEGILAGRFGRQASAFFARRPGIRPGPAGAAPQFRPWRFTSPLLRRVLLVNALPLALLVAALLYLDQYQNGLLVGEVNALREQARIYAGALGQSAVRTPEGRRHGEPVLVGDLARPLLRRLTEPTPFSVARLYAPDGRIIADSNPDSPDGAPPRVPSAAGQPRRSLMGHVIAGLGRFYDALLSLLPPASDGLVVERKNGEKEGLQWSPDVREQLHLGGTSESAEMPPYIRRTRDDRLLVTVAEPVQHDGRTVGIVLLTRAAGEVDRSLEAVRRSIIDLFALALGITVLLSWYLSRTITRPILSLARAAISMREGAGRTGAVPAALRRRTDEIGELGQALEQSARALVGPDGCHGAVRGRCQPRDQEPAVVDRERHRDAAPDRGCRATAQADGDHRRGRGPAGPADIGYRECEPG